eukprot:scaffold55253_cov23-Tisochrysis_lutea.AAC.1
MERTCWRVKDDFYEGSRQAQDMAKCIVQMYPKASGGHKFRGKRCRQYPHVLEFHTLHGAAVVMR